MGREGRDYWKAQLSGYSSGHLSAHPRRKPRFCRINGVILGRYDKNGPFNTLYVPAPFLRKSENVVEVFEYDDLGRPAIQFLNHPLIGGI